MQLAGLFRATQTDECPAAGLGWAEAGADAGGGVQRNVTLEFVGELRLKGLGAEQAAETDDECF
jgi:hypothetical protein